MGHIQTEIQDSFAEKTNRDREFPGTFFNQSIVRFDWVMNNILFCRIFCCHKWLFQVITAMPSPHITKSCVNYLILFRMGFFGDERPPALKSVTHILQWCIPATVMPSLKKIQKTYKSRDTPLDFLWNQQIFTGN